MGFVFKIIGCWTKGRKVKFIIYAKARKRDFILKYGYFVEKIKSWRRIVRRVYFNIL